MTIKLIAIGKTDSKDLQALIAQYQKRIGHYIKFEIKIIPDLKNAKNLNKEQQKEKEGKMILKHLSATDILVLFDEKGVPYTSKKFAEYLQQKMNSASKQLVFAIGGPYGFSSEVYEKAAGKISLSKMTFSHQMVRLFITEQIYRAFTILRNEPYHHE